MITENLLTILYLAAGGLTALLVPFIIMQWHKIKANLSEQRLHQLMFIAGIAVQAAEQLGLNGQQAKNFAISRVEALADHYGIAIQLDDIGDIIEAAVWDQINRYRPILIDGDDGVLE